MDKERVRKDKIFVRSPFNYDVAHASRESGLLCLDESLTLQSQAADADINVIVKRFGITGVMPQGFKLPTYQDFEGLFDYRSAVEAVRNAQYMFVQVPADIRARFDNDPGKFMAFCVNPANLAELRKMGLAKPEDVVVAQAKPA